MHVFLELAEWKALIEGLPLGGALRSGRQPGHGGAAHPGLGFKIGAVPGAQAAGGGCQAVPPGGRAAVAQRGGGW